MNQSLGAAMEARAKEHLENAGMNCVMQNFRCKVGEIDLIMCDAETLVFVEVKYRNSNTYGSPEQSVTPTKQRRVVRAAQVFLKRHRRWQDLPCRFDVVGISPDGDQLHINWIPRAFTADVAR